jgi:Na+-transporting methylmalonyl-CoA/oxaloacetate decarboxylase gamma subunit
MPILVMGVTALVIFLVLGAMFFAAMEAEHRKREKIDKQAETPKTMAHTAGH